MRTALVRGLTHVPLRGLFLLLRSVRRETIDYHIGVRLANDADGLLAHKDGELVELEESAATRFRVARREQLAPPLRLVARVLQGAGVARVLQGLVHEDHGEDARVRLDTVALLVVVHA